MSIKQVFKIVVLLITMHAAAVYAAPLLITTDATNAPLTGWDGSGIKGAAVSVWGKDLGTSGIVSIAGQVLSSADPNQVAEWGATTNPTTPRGLARITFWLNSNMTVGDTSITITTGGDTSNALPFHTRTLGSSHIIFIDAAGGSNSIARASVDIAHPWKTLGKARSDTHPGDCIYLREGTYTEQDRYNSMMAFYDAPWAIGEEDNSVLFSAYPTENVQIGTGDSSLDYFVWIDPNATYNVFNYWTFSKLSVIVYDKAFYIWPDIWNSNGNYTGLRIVGNMLRHTFGGATNGVGFTINAYGNFYGFDITANYFPNCGHGLGGPDEGTPKYCIYLGGGWPTSGAPSSVGNDIDIGWNEFYNSSGRGIDVYAHRDGDKFNNLRIHHNMMDTFGTNPIVVGGGDSNGGGEWAAINDCYIYDNIIVNGGAELRFTEGSEGSHGGNFYIYNNSFYNNGSDSASCDFQITGPTLLEFKNNIVYSGAQASCYVSYYGGNAGGSTGDHNLWYGQGAGPSWSTTGDLDDTDPQFISTSDYHLQTTSPAKNAGATIAMVTTDFDGVSRPQGSAYDIGAYEVEDAVHNITISFGSGTKSIQFGSGTKTITFYPN